jgi:hypothetical protein
MPFISFGRGTPNSKNDRDMLVKVSPRIVPFEIENTMKFLPGGKANPFTKGIPDAFKGAKNFKLGAVEL